MGTSPSALAHPASVSADPAAACLGEQEQHAACNGQALATPSDTQLQHEFTVFRQSYAGEAALQTNKALLAASYSKAKALAAQVADCASVINAMTHVLQHVSGTMPPTAFNSTRVSTDGLPASSWHPSESWFVCTNKTCMQS